MQKSKSVFETGHGADGFVRFSLVGGVFVVDIFFKRETKAP